LLLERKEKVGERLSFKFNKVVSLTVSATVLPMDLARFMRLAFHTHYILRE